jgi:hypothetical protein
LEEWQNLAEMDLTKVNTCHIVVIYSKSQGVKKMTQQEFYGLPEVREQLDIQKTNPYGSKEHREAFRKISDIAKNHGVIDQYRKAGGGTDY